MIYNELGKTKLKVSRLGFGTMRLPTIGSNDNIDKDEASKMLEYGIENGINLIDTAYPYHSKTLEECRALGINDSMIHEDFMIGTPDLEIIAHCRDGKSVQIFKDGTWAF